MARLVWDRLSTSGLSHGVLYADTAEVWNGLLSIETEEEDTDVNYAYVDGRKYQRQARPGSFAGSVSAITVPTLLQENGNILPYLRNRRGDTLDFTYQSGTELHIVYNVLFVDEGAERQTTSDDLEPLEFSWSFTTRPNNIPGFKPSAHLVVDLSKASYEAIALLEDFLYGSDTTEPRLPPPSELIEMFEAYLALEIIDNGDGTWTAIDKYNLLTMIDDTTFQIDTESALYIDQETYTISSY